MLWWKSGGGKKHGTGPLQRLHIYAQHKCNNERARQLRHQQGEGQPQKEPKVNHPKAAPTEPPFQALRLPQPDPRRQAQSVMFAMPVRRQKAASRKRDRMEGQYRLAPQGVTAAKPHVEKGI